jgi:DNA-binding GntR family transcriptional regulator
MRETFQEKAYNWVRNKIRQNFYQPGMPLKEEVLAKEIGISATPVREALRRLEREGWVESLPYKGCFFKKYTLDELRELCILRESVEVACVSEILKNATDSDWKRLDDIISTGEKIVEEINEGKENPDVLEIKIREFDEQFHSAFIDASHCKQLISLAETWNVQIQGFASRPFFNNQTKALEQFHYVVDQHKATCTALKLNWEQATRELVRAHISTSFEHLLEQLEKEPKKNLKKSKKRR